MRLLICALLASAVIYSSSTDASPAGARSLEISFDSAVDLLPGTSVVLEGRRLGYVVSLSPNKESCTVVLDAPSEQPNAATVLRRGATAVIASTWSGKAQGTLTYIEVFNPPEASAFGAQETMLLLGYADFESLWSNVHARHWIDAQTQPVL